MLNYYRARNQLVAAQHDIEILKTDTDTLHEECWQTEEVTTTAQVISGRKFIVKYISVRCVKSRSAEFGKNLIWCGNFNQVNLIIET